MINSKLPKGFLPFQASEVRALLGDFSEGDKSRLDDSFADLVQDKQMGDGGAYRYRRYSRFLYKKEPSSRAPVLQLTAGNSIRQSVADNSLNGGIERTYQALTEDVLSNPLLSQLIEHDIAVVRRVDPELFAQSVLVGVHQVRIVAQPGKEGKPTPEGIHRDAERFTFQHLWNREGVEGGEFRAYDQSHNLTYSWLQEIQFDSVLFEGHTWHSASPIQCRPGSAGGYRDIFLIDFEPAASSSSV